MTPLHLHSSTDERRSYATPSPLRLPQELNVRSLSLINELRSQRNFCSYAPSPSAVCVVFLCFFQSSGRHSATSTDPALVSNLCDCPIKIATLGARHQVRTRSLLHVNLPTSCSRLQGGFQTFTFGKLSYDTLDWTYFFPTRTHLIAYSEVCGGLTLGVGQYLGSKL